MTFRFIMAFGIVLLAISVVRWFYCDANPSRCSDKIPASVWQWISK